MIIPIGATRPEEIENLIRKGAEAIKIGLEKGNVFVHCHFGVSRSTTLIMGYFILYLKKEYQESLDFIKNKRFQVSPEKNFVVVLKQFAGN